MNKVRITEETLVKRNDEVFVNTIDDEVVMMHIQTGKYYGLDEVGSRIWEFINEKAKVSDIIEQLVQEYDVTYEECKKDVVDLLDDLQSNDLIVTE
jgi:polyhydroxyalkanoate synthesis regulator phasin